MDNGSFDPNTTDICKESLRSLSVFNFVWISLASLVLMENLLLFVVMVYQWTILRHNVVYYYAANVLLSSVIYSIVGFIETLQTYTYGSTAESLRFDKDNEKHISEMTAYALRKALLPCMIIVINLTDMALIYGVSDNAYFVGRYSDPKSVTRTDAPVFRNHKQTKKRISLQIHGIRWKKCKAASSILFSWLFPLSLLIPVYFGWNCVRHCRCLPAFYNTGIECTTDLNSATNCSRLWRTISQSFVIMISTIWYISKIMTIILLSKTVRQFIRIHRPRESLRESSRNQNNPNGSSTNKEDAPQSGQSSGKRTGDPENSLDIEPTTSHYSLYTSNMNVKHCTFQRQVEMRNRLYSTLSNNHANDRPPLDPMIKLLIVLVLFSTISFFPTATHWLLDVTVLTITIVERKRTDPAHNGRSRRAETTVTSINVVNTVATAPAIPSMESALNGNNHNSMSDGLDISDKGVHSETPVNSKKVFSLKVSHFADGKIQSILQEVYVEEGLKQTKQTFEQN